MPFDFASTIYARFVSENQQNSNMYIVDTPPEDEVEEPVHVLESRDYEEMTHVCHVCGEEYGITPVHVCAPFRVQFNGLRVGAMEYGAVSFLHDVIFKDYLEQVSTLFRLWDEPSYICSSCLKQKLESETSRRCTFCGDSHHVSVANVVKADGTSSIIPVCMSCVSRGEIRYCGDCNKIFIASNMVCPDGYGYICRECKSKRRRCGSCGNVRRPYQLTTNPVTDEPICGDCLYNAINRYDYIPHSYTFFHTKDETAKRYIGTEIEIEAPDGAMYGENDAAYEKAVQAYAVVPLLLHKWKEHLFLKHDGSLRCGFEIVSQPMSVRFHKQFDWEGVFEAIQTYGFSAKSSCGLHFHVSKAAFGSTEEKRDYNISKMCLMVDILWNWLLLFVKRDRRQANRYAAPYGITLEDSSMSAISKTKADFSKYHAVNLLHNRTVEIRVLQGVSTADEFRRNLELVDCLVTLALRHSFKSLKKINPLWLAETAANKGYSLLSHRILECKAPFTPIVEEAPPPSNRIRRPSPIPVRDTQSISRPTSYYDYARLYNIADQCAHDRMRAEAYEAMMQCMPPDFALPENVDP